jgi:hypothetical protein
MNHIVISRSVTESVFDSRDGTKLLEAIHKWYISWIVQLMEQDKGSFAQFLMHLAGSRTVGHDVAYTPTAKEL